MNSTHRNWAIVLAAGQGTRLSSLTADAAGRAVPKQYCSLSGRGTLLQDALRRARSIAERTRVCAVVAEQHAQWWPSTLGTMMMDNIFVQPDNRGTANGILLPLLSILAREPLARVMFLPADHFVSNEALLAAAMRTAVGRAEAAPNDILLVGIEPAEADSELGYIVPSSSSGTSRRVLRFVEKPTAELAASLVADGALWNSFIFTSTGTALLSLYRERIPAIVRAMEHALVGGCAAAIDELYASLPVLDFSRDILIGSERRLQVIPTAGTGWTDLGTPRRLGAVLRRRGLVASGRQVVKYGTARAPVNLANAFLRSAARSLDASLNSRS